MEKNEIVAQKAQLVYDTAHNTVYLMGGSFILGCLVTLLLLLVLDFVRRNKSTANG
jgi:hypothetical protein